MKVATIVTICSKRTMRGISRAVHSQTATSVTDGGHFSPRMQQLNASMARLCGKKQSGINVWNRASSSSRRLCLRSHASTFKYFGRLPQSVREPQVERDAEVEGAEMVAHFDNTDGIAKESMHDSSTKQYCLN